MPDEFDYNLENVQIISAQSELSKCEDSSGLRDSLKLKSESLNQVVQKPKMINSIDPEDPQYQYRAYQRYL